MKKVTLLALHLGHGGIEKAVSDLANNLVDKYKVEIISTYKINEEPAYHLNSNINVTYLMNKKPNRKEFDLAVKSHNPFKIIRELCRALRILRAKKNLMIKAIKDLDSDVVISTRDYLNMLLGKYGNKNQIKIGWEHNHHNGNMKYFNKICNSVKNLDYFVLVSKELFRDYDIKLHDTDCKCVYIPNMIDFDENAILSSLSKNTLINISRFSPEKGLFDLIDVVSILKEKNIDFKLNLIGDGALREKLEVYARENSVDDCIEFLGFRGTDDINKYLSDSSLYVMTSFTESFGIVLLESFSHGVPAIAFSSAQGANELINKDVGYIIKNRDKEEMANTIINYLENKKLFKDKQNLIVKKAKEFSFEVVIQKWCDIIDKVSL